MDCLGKGPSVHDLLWTQIKGDSGGGSGGENGGFSVDWNELLQIFLATFSFMLVFFTSVCPDDGRCSSVCKFMASQYIYLIRREEINRLSSDYIKYLMGCLGKALREDQGKEVEGLSEYPAVSSPT
ncbi:unnamed protein product [Spirodela intermedia]|uniref:Uncharacterized protein n=1 Tax=Spirodela intermedia TaxID=51605 RepID=A0A7I8IR97_SPIIN|nr:unnamed protein product [Spirodela intermedia]CAA6660323.1 unnamed protein product [Spirodela intermedia]